MLLFSLKRVPSYKLQYLHRCKSLCLSVCLSGSRPDSPTSRFCYQYIRSAESKGSFMLTVGKLTTVPARCPYFINVCVQLTKTIDY